MNNQSIYILSAPIQTGKTTCLMEWCKNRKDVFGILTPIIQQERMFMNVHTKELFAMEVTEKEKNALEIGRYRFSMHAFKQANSIIQSALNKDGWLIVDEIGPLELQQKGFYTAIKKILNNRSINLKIIFVVRDSILDRVIDFFNMDKLTIIFLDTSMNIEN